MTRLVQCQRYGQQLEGLPAPPFPGPRGERIYQNVSKQAWQDWVAHQTMLINEKHLNLMDKASREYLAQQMDRFFAGEDVDRAEGYVPPESQTKDS